MSTIEKLGIDRMPPDERPQLIEEIWDSLSLAEDVEIPESHREELERRLDAADANPGAGSPWEEVLARLH